MLHLHFTFCGFTFVLYLLTQNGTENISALSRDLLKITYQGHRDYLVGKTELLMDENISARILTIQKLPDTDREHILFTIDAMIRDAKARLAYS